MIYLIKFCLLEKINCFLPTFEVMTQVHCFGNAYKLPYEKVNTKTHEKLQTETLHGWIWGLLWKKNLQDSQVSFVLSPTAWMEHLYQKWVEQSFRVKLQISAFQPRGYSGNSHVYKRRPFLTLSLPPSLPLWSHWLVEVEAPDLSQANEPLLFETPDKTC